MRLTLIDSLGISFKGKRCLDVACNNGTVGTQLGMYVRRDPPANPPSDYKTALLILLLYPKPSILGALEITGVHIDAKLVRKAEELLALRASRFTPAPIPLRIPSHSSTTFPSPLFSDMVAFHLLRLPHPIPYD